MNDLRDVFSPDVLVAIERFVDERVEAALTELDAERAIPPVLTISEAAGYLRVSERHVQRLIARRELRAARWGGVCLFAWSTATRSLRAAARRASCRPTTTRHRLWILGARSPAPVART
jgi:excisionase family DNA binding protein